jgi:hypothetical protein
LILPLFILGILSLLGISLSFEDTITRECKFDRLDKEVLGSSSHLEASNGQRSRILNVGVGNAKWGPGLVGCCVFPHTTGCKPYPHRLSYYRETNPLSAFFIMEYDPKGHQLEAFGQVRLFECDDKEVSATDRMLKQAHSILNATKSKTASLWPNLQRALQRGGFPYLAHCYGDMHGELFAQWVLFSDFTLYNECPLQHNQRLQH